MGRFLGWADLGGFDAMATGISERVAAGGELRAAMMRLRRLDDRRNLAHLAADWATIAAIAAAAIGFAESRGALGLSWWWNVPVFAAAVALMGGALHRLSGLGHEAAHYTFLRNKFANDLAADLFCFFPVWSTTHLYRLFHMAHHQYVNDPERDPDLVNMGASKKVDQFPMTRWRFVREYFLRPLTSPWTFAWYQWDYLYVNVFGKGGNVYMARVPDGDGATKNLRLGTWLGLAYVLGLNAGFWWLSWSGRGGWVAPAGLAAWVPAILVLAVLPRRALFQSPFRQPYSTRFASALRLTWFTALLVGMAVLREATGGRSVPYVFLLYVLPMMTTFPLFLLIRDVYQHANSDHDRVTNTRVFRTDPLTNWAVFVHGQGLHTPHHIYPAVPHYHLEELHALLKQYDVDYAERVVECEGTFANNGGGRPTILDVLSAERG